MKGSRYSDLAWRAVEQDRLLEHGHRLVLWEVLTQGPRYYDECRGDGGSDGAYGGGYGGHASGDGYGDGCNDGDPGKGGFGSGCNGDGGDDQNLHTIGALEDP